MLVPPQVLGGDRLAVAVAVEIAVVVDELAVGVQDHLAALLVEGGDTLFQLLPAAQGVGDGVVGIVVVVAARVPAEHEQRVDPGGQSFVADGPHGAEGVDVFPVLGAHDDPLPAVHVPDGFRDAVELEPAFRPGPVLVGPLVPGALMGRNDEVFARHLIARPEKGEFRHGQIDPVGLFQFDDVAGGLETVVVIAEIEPFAPGIQVEAVEGSAAAGITGDAALIDEVLPLIGGGVVAERRLRIGQAGPDPPALFGGVERHFRSFAAQGDEGEVALPDDIVLDHAVEDGDGKMHFVVDQLAQHGDDHVELLPLGAGQVPVLHLEFPGKRGDPHRRAFGGKLHLLIVTAVADEPPQTVGRSELRSRNQTAERQQSTVVSQFQTQKFVFDDFRHKQPQLLHGG